MAEFAGEVGRSRAEAGRQWLSALCADGDMLRHIESVCTPREVRILAMRFGLDGGSPRSLQEIGAVMEISRERVRQLELRALKRLEQAAGAARVWPASAEPHAGDTPPGAARLPADPA